jgi:hypothetical protein
MAEAVEGVVATKVTMTLKVTTATEVTANREVADGG